MNFPGIRLLRRSTVQDAGVDSQIDRSLALLKDVPVPAGLNERLLARIDAECSSGQQADASVLATLAALGSVREPMYLKQRLAERLAREPIASASPAGSSGWLPWAALSSVAAGLAIAVGVHAHSVQPLVPASPRPAASAQTVHPAFVPEQRGIRAGALNTNGVVTTARARQQNSVDEALEQRTGQHHKTRNAKLEPPVATSPSR